MNIDRSVFRHINDFARDTSWAHSFMAAYALWGGLVVLAALLVFSWWRARHQHDSSRLVATVILTGVATIVALASTKVIGPLVARTRPFAAMPHVEVLLRHSADNSFPSDHSMIAGAFAVGLFFVFRKIGVIAAFLAVLLAFSRVYCGVHYPSDVLGGLLIGGAIAAVLVLLLRRPAASVVGWLASTPLAPLVAVQRRALETHKIPV